MQSWFCSHKCSHGTCGINFQNVLIPSDILYNGIISTQFYSCALPLHIGLHKMVFPQIVKQPSPLSCYQYLLIIAVQHNEMAVLVSPLSPLLLPSLQPHYCGCLGTLCFIWWRVVSGDPSSCYLPFSSKLLSQSNFTQFFPSDMGKGRLWEVSNFLLQSSPS